MQCPCCGAPVERDRILVSIDTRSVSVPWRSEPLLIKRGLRLVEMLLIFAKNFERVVTFDKLISGLYGVREPDSARGALTVYVYHLGQQIAAIGLAIESVYGVGYRMVRVEA
jgi:DNA-binding response OmpR family regulator